jgi:zinc protease
MRKLAFPVVLLALGALAQAPAKPAPKPAAPQAPVVAAPKPWNKIVFPKLGDIRLPEVQRYTLPNGMKLFLVEDHRLPLIDGRAIIRTGARWVPADKAGLAGIFGSAQRTGGTKTRSGDQLDEMLEAIAASVETSVGMSSASAAFSAQRGDEDKVLEIFADVLMNPEFRQDKIELAKVTAKTEISRRNDDFQDVARREFRKLVYGPTSPYARHAEYWTIDEISRDDLLAFHRRYYHPNNILLGVWGDFRAAEMKARIERAFANWKPAPRLDLPPVPQVDPGSRSGLFLARKEDVNQTSVRLGHVGGRISDPEYFEVTVLAQILCAGDFSSRVTRKIRSEMGLAYSAGGDWSASYDYSGVFVVGVDTKSETTAKAIEETVKLIREIREKEVSDEELRIAKESLLNSFVFNFQNTGQILERIMTYEYYQYPPDFLDKYRAGIEKVTKADVLRAAQRHLQPAHLAILAVGKDKDFDKPLDKLAGYGPFATVDIAIPDKKPAPPGSPAPSAPAAAVERGRQVLARAIQAAGGAERIRAVRDVEFRAKATLYAPQGELGLDIRDITVLPSTTRQEIETPFGLIINFFDGSNGWAQNPGGLQDLNDQQKTNFRQAFFRQNYHLLSGAPGLSVVFERRDGENDVVLVTRGDDSVRLFVDSAGRIVKKAYRGQTLAGPADLEDTLSDFREVSGVQVPFKSVITANGQKYLEAAVSELKINTGVDPAKLGEKPK